jgi:hypothetical protein
MGAFSWATDADALLKTKADLPAGRDDQFMGILRSNAAKARKDRLIPQGAGSDQNFELLNLERAA